MLLYAIVLVINLLKVTTEKQGLILLKISIGWSLLDVLHGTPVIKKKVRAERNPVYKDRASLSEGWCA